MSPETEHPSAPDCFGTSSVRGTRSILPQVTRNCLLFAGFISLISQLIIFREFLNVFDCNELLIGLLLFTWMIFTSIGSYAGIGLAKSHYSDRTAGLLFLAAGILPVFAVAVLYYLKFTLLPPGISGGLVTAQLFALILLLPVCLVNGILFSLLSSFNTHTKAGSNQTAAAYGYETMGSVIAGILFTIALSYLLSAMETLFLVSSMTILFFALIFSTSVINRTILIAFSLAVIAIGLSGYPETFLRSLQYPGQKILFSKDTPYGNVCAVGSSGQINIFQNGILFCSTQNDQGYEESVHFALLQHKSPRSVLVVSGGINGTIRQAAKYSSISRLDYAEINPWLIKAETALMPVTDTSRLRILSTDARSHIKNCINQYDAIILNLPEPLNAQINRYYTLEFYTEVRSALKPGGIFETALAATPNYVSGEGITLNASVFQTLKQVFPNVRLIVSGKNYFIASESKVSVKIDSLLNLHPVENDFVNKYYFDDELTTLRSTMVLENLQSSRTGLNRDNHPVTYVFQINEWLARFESGYGGKITVVILLVLVLSIFIFQIRSFSSTSFTVFSSAFAGASAVFLLIFIFQILFGQIYQVIGLLFAVYMAGLSTGTFAVAKMRPINTRKILLSFQGILFGLILLMPLYIYFEPVPGISRFLVKAFILFYTFLISFAAGVLFGKSASVKMYGVDLIASALGTLLTSVFLLPVAGIWITVICSSALLAASFAVNLRNHY